MKQMASVCNIVCVHLVPQNFRVEEIYLDLVWKREGRKAKREESVPASGCGDT